ncbi:MAG: competence/damage-inducible protein A [Chloroflexi bacterium]|nr:competence/damage-inducible protein A [Chloroflexota bacterium]
MGRMQAEIVATGTELLMGEIQDTNSSYLAGQLPGLGLELLQITLVGDRTDHLVEVLERAWKRSAYTFTIGGLGPTHDDVTREAIARVFREELSVDPHLLQELTRTFQRRGSLMPQSNVRQAQLIPSAVGLPNPAGTAPGWWAEKEGRVIVALPGPPKELQEMWERAVVPRIRQRVTGSVVLTRTLKTIGLPEATVGEMVAPVLGGENPYVGIYARPDGIHLRAIARGASHGEALALLEPAVERMRQLLGAFVWGTDAETPGESVGALLRQRGLTLATMESCTGGLLAHTITEVPGSSGYFRGGIVSYGSELKIASGVPAGLIDQHGAVSAEVAAAMAKAARERLKADYGIGITGVAGPDELEGKPAGTVYIGIARAGGEEAEHYRFLANNRSIVKRRAVTTALLNLRRLLRVAS